MATKKQQRRRQKQRRHEYEEVWVDADGNEIDYEPADSDKSGAAKTSPKGKAQPAKGRSGRVPKEIKPPSWQRVARRAFLLAPLLFVALSFGKHPSPIYVRLGIAIGYTALFVPTFYWIDRLAYRRYLRTTGQPVPTRKS
ncbi:MAG TPA: hypothetical protein VG073_07750 [Gaiellaceae bacterium]|nr:hypothetical protein [Gaiellaceae bacterium]